MVDASYRYLIDTYQKALNYFAQLPPEQQPEQMGKISGNCMREMLLYMFEHRNSFRLLLQCADGTRYAAMIDELVELEVESTHQLTQKEKSLLQRFRRQFRDLLKLRPAST